MGQKIHALVQNADDEDTAFLLLVEDDMAGAGQAQQAGADMVRLST
jgi:hypothetical protein